MKLTFTILLEYIQLGKYFVIFVLYKDVLDVICKISISFVNKYFLLLINSFHCSNDLLSFSFNTFFNSKSIMVNFCKSWS